jgi:hypothetical protein
MISKVCGSGFSPKKSELWIAMFPYGDIAVRSRELAGSQRE